MPVKPIYGKEARAALLNGVEKLNKAVATTMGPAGRWNLFRHMGVVISTRDGVTVAREINLSDPYESQGADLAKNAAGQTVNEAGDGTTTAVLLTHAIFKAGCEAINAGAEPVQLVRGIERAKTVIVGEYDAKAKKFQGGILETLAVPCSPELAFQAARISANGDDAIAKVVSEAILKIGVDGALTIGDSHSPDHVLEVVDGMQINAGYAHPYFITDVQRNRVAYDNVTVALINRRVSSSKEAEGIMIAAVKAAQKASRALAILLIVDDIDPEALQVILKNKLKTHEPPIPIVVVRAPLWGDARRDLLDDIGLLSGAKRIESPAGKDYDLLNSSDFGFLERIVVTASKTILTAAPYSDFYRQNKVEPYLNRIKTLVADEGLRPDERDAAKGRLAALTGGVAVIKVGGTSADAVQETKFRVEDAIHATRAAVSDGVVPGGGSALLFSRMIAVSVPTDAITGSEEIGEDLLYSVLSAPLEQIAKNAGHDADHIVARVTLGEQSTNAHRCGFDASNGQYLDDMIASGIVDPLRVVRAALNAAAAAAGVLLKTECLIADEPQEPRR